MFHLYTILFNKHILGLGLMEACPAESLSVHSLNTTHLQQMGAPS